MDRTQLGLLQELVQSTVITVGGYWAPLSGLARVLEELGELAIYIETADYGDEFASELSDVLIITMCVANQYCAKLYKPKIEVDYSGLSTKTLFFQLVSACGELARILNSYDGNKKLKATETTVTVEDKASSVCQFVWAIAQKNSIQIQETAVETLSRARRRDVDRFEALYDPSLSDSREKYLEFTKTTSKVWGLRDSISHEILGDLMNNEDTIKRFLKFGKIEKIMTLVLKINSSQYSSVNMGKYSESLKCERKGNFIVLTG